MRTITLLRRPVLGPVLAALLSAGPAAAETRTLTIASWAGPNHVVNAEIWPAFVERLEEVSGGALTARVALNLVPPPAMADLVLDGGADLTFVFHGYNAGRFVTPQLVELPGTEGSAEATSVAYWRVWEAMLSEAGEQDEFKTVAMFTHGPAQLHLAEPIDGLADVEGLKIRAPGGVGSVVVDGLGAVGIQVPAPKIYETLASGAADGVAISADARINYNLDEVAPVMFEVPGGLYRGSFAVLMNRGVWEDLPPDLREALDAELFGEPTSRLFGELWDESDSAAIENSRSLGNPVVALVEGDAALLAPVIEEARALVLGRVAERGIDAEAALAMFEAEVAREMGAAGG